MASLVYAASALAVLVSSPNYGYPLNSPRILAVAATCLFLIAAIRVFRGHRFADLAALIGALVAWRLFAPTMLNSYLFSPWLTFNMPDPSLLDIRREFLFAGLIIAATSILVAATAWSLLRIAPQGWRIRKLPLRDRIWPGFAATFLFVIVWYVGAVARYQIPIYDLHSNPPRILVSHVEKHGLQFHETTLEVYRNKVFYLARDDRKLFQYSFRRSVSIGRIADKYFQLIDSLPESHPAFVGLDVPYYIPPRTWNADRWFVYVTPGREPITMDVSVMPKSVLELFYDSQRSPVARVQQETRRDVSFGFCYDPTY